VAQSSFISSFKRLTINYKLPLFAITLLVAIELLIRTFWIHPIVPDNVYSSLTPYYDYGFEVHDDLIDISSNGHVEVYYNRNFNIFRQAAELNKASSIYEFFGSSVSHGEKNKNYPYFIQQLLTEKKENVNVLNFSADGVGARRINKILASSHQVKPGIVFYHPHGSNEYEDERDFKQYKALEEKFSSFLLKSQLISLTKRAIDLFSKFIKTPVDGNSEIIASKDIKNIERWNKTLAQSVEQFINDPWLKDIPIIIVSRVERNLGSTGYSNKTVKDINNILLDKMANCDHCFYFNTVKLFEQKGDSDTTKHKLFVDNSHYTHEGHKLLADGLFNFIHTIDLK